MDYKKLRQRALIFDCLVIAVAIVTLYLSANTALPVWAAVALLILTVLLLVAAVTYAARARKVANAEYKKLQQAADQAVLESKKETKQD